MKPCAKCAGRKIKFVRDEDLRITVKCEKCGAEVITSSFTVDNATGYWNMEQARIERTRKAKELKEAAG
jgi:hypothetical protein